MSSSQSKDLTHLLPPHANDSVVVVDRPFVTLTYAQTLDGSIATAQRTQVKISGDESMAMTHFLRAHHDAILVGSGTVLADNPRLNSRLPNAPSQPRPVILDSHLRCPDSANFLSTASRPDPIIFCLGRHYTEEKASKLAAKRAKVVKIGETGDGKLDLVEVLKYLGTQGVRSVMVEGGATIIEVFLRDRLADRVIVTIAPVFLGGLRTLGEPLGHPLVLENLTYDRLGQDIVVSGYPGKTC